MIEAKRTYTMEFKAQAVLELMSSKKTAAKLSHEHGIKNNLIYTWRALFIEWCMCAFQ